jgi:hypothetical protein
LTGLFYPDYSDPSTSEELIPALAIPRIFANKIDSVSKSEEITMFMQTPSGNPVREWLEGPACAVCQAFFLLYPTYSFHMRKYGNLEGFAIQYQRKLYLVP